MERHELDRYRDRLQQIVARLRPEVRSITEQALSPSGGQATGALTNAPMHLADMGTEEFLHGINAVLLENEEYLINEARAALERIDSELYGACEYCGAAIPPERLEAMPFARHCVICSEALGEGAKADHNVGRPLRPEDTFAPEGAMNEDRRPERNAGFEPALRSSAPQADRHAAGTPGGGTALGGLAGGTFGSGEPNVADLDEAAGDGGFDAREARDEAAADEPQSGRAGGAVGGTPAGKRTKPR